MITQIKQDSGSRIVDCGENPPSTIHHPRSAIGLRNPSSLLLCLIFSGLVFIPRAEAASPADPAKRILIHHNGRVKSFDAFSRQTLELITGKETWEKKPAVLFLLEALYYRDAVKDIKWIRVDYKELKSALGLPADRRHFSFNETKPSADKLESLVRSARAKRDQDLRPSMLEQKAESLYGSLIETMQLVSGESIKVIPASGESPWLSPYDPHAPPLGAKFKEIVQAFGDQKYEDFNRKVEAWIREVDGSTGQAYRQKTDLEVRYLNLRPFEYAWIAYLLSFVCLSFLKKRRALKLLGVSLVFAAILFHTYGLVLRTLILSRPPVSNMYESMVFMNWVLMVCALIFAVVRKNWVPASIGALLSGVIMIYGNLLPIDTSLEVLVPVLRSNYWLTVHVLTIVASYGVLGLAMGLGHRHLVLWLRGKLSHAEGERSGALIHRVIQVGILLLGAGTVLGGVWANESWGRFWGWDPKETWALITFLGYLLIVHLKYAKKISAFWLAISAVLGFLLVLMTWYGVNFVLGRGLHSYGQGAGGMVWVVVYLVFEALFLIYVLFRKYTGPANTS